MFDLQRRVNECYTLSVDCVHSSSSSSMFKNIIANYLVKAGYT